MPTIKLRSSTGAAAGAAFFWATLRGVLIFLVGFLLALAARKFSSSTEELTVASGDFFILPTIVLTLFALEAFGVGGLTFLTETGLAPAFFAVGAGFLALLATGLVIFVGLTLLTMMLPLN
ncbi:MAG: hypothetical protein U1C96_05930 [Gallionella sp.]|nr:hypothetical protein [Gallionella sp.]